MLYNRIEDQAPHAISCHAILLCSCQQALEQFRCKFQCCSFDCRLAPLSACNATVVAEFSRLSGRLLLLPPGAAGVAAALAAAGVNGRRPLEMFFPFDPYLLRRSAAVLDLKCGASVAEWALVRMSCHWAGCEYFRLLCTCWSCLSQSNFAHVSRFYSITYGPSVRLWCAWCTERACKS